MMKGRRGAHLLIVTDVFGLSAPLTDLVRSLSERFETIEILDPYEGIECGFLDEASAYRAFTDKGGVAWYATLAAQQIAGLSGPSYLLGFSAGASALWKAVSQVPCAHVSKAWLFYGGQIRNFVECEPNCPVHLVFPSREDHFDVEDLIGKLRGRAHVTLEKTRYLHGFMNPLSRNFEPEGLRGFLRRMSEEP